ncbi:MAG: hypothetical protein ACRERV_03445 [Methylococcales bacterium]
MKKLFTMLIGLLLFLCGNARADQVIADDLIVQGSACVGFDCVNNESFGFDTIRLKENNLRIKFEDTSAGGFPSTDWQLTANDSASGGSNKFSIEDITTSRVPFTITGGATTNSIFVSSSGRVGFRTSTPVLDLHVKQGDTPALRLEQDGTAGFTAQTWDIAGNEANFFIRDVTGGSRLPFRIRPGAPTSSIDISASGNVGIGTDSPSAKLHVSSTNTQDVFAGLGENPSASCALNVGYAGTSFGPGKGFVNVRPCTAGTPDFRILVANSTIVTVKTSGMNVTGSLSVNNTALNVPDYVFDSDYPLLPLQELATYVVKEKHLPDIPPAREVADQGIDLGAMQMKLLKKVEELTLYTIQQDRKMTNLEEKNRKLASENTRLQSRLSAVEAIINEDVQQKARQGKTSF